MSDFFPLIGAPRDKHEAQMVYPLRHSYWWAPRRALMVAGFAMALLGILGFVFEWESTAAVLYMDTTKSIIFLAAGVALYWIGEVWSSPWKRNVAGVLALAYLALGIVGVAAGDSADNLGFTHINRPWEATIWLGTGAWTAITVWWPRRFWDYEWATGTSSGISMG